MEDNNSKRSSNMLDNLTRFLQYWADTVPDQELFVFYQGDVRTSYSCRRVYELGGRFARRLREEYGFQKGDIIANSLPNSPERLFTDLGIVLAGCISLTIETMFSDGSDFMTSARNSGLQGVIVSPEGDSPAWKILSPYVTTDLTSPTGQIICERAPEMRTAIFVGRHTQGILVLEDLEQDCQDSLVEKDLHPEDIACIITTSGSTGYCKLVPKTHRDMTGDPVQHAEPSPSVVQYNDRPMGWLGGHPATSYVHGHKRVLLDVWDTQGSKVGVDVWSIIRQEKVTHTFMLPLDVNSMLRRATSDQLGQYKVDMLFCGGQPIRKNQFADCFLIAKQVVATYASTEVGLISIGIINEGTKIRDYYCGKLASDKELRIVKEDGRLCETGELGLIQVRGQRVFKGYLNRVEDPDPKTVSAFTPDGWFKMDDTGYLDEDNNLYCLGRLQDVISFGSTFIYPGWLEPKIVAHPEIEEAVIVPVSDPVLYQNICAIVQTVAGSRLDEAGLKKIFETMLMDAEDIEGTPIPKYYMILDSIPRNANGKMDRKSLRQIAEKKFGNQ